MRNNFIAFFNSYESDFMITFVNYAFIVSSIIISSAVCRNESKACWSWPTTSASNFSLNSLSLHMVS